MINPGALLERLRGFDPERALGLRPDYPAVAVALEEGEAVLVRVGRRRRGRPVVEVLGAQPLPEHAVPASPFESDPGSLDELVERLRALYQATGVKPGRVSLVLPDNLAKVTLVALPERPGSRRQLEQILRFRMRRAVPFRAEDAVLSYQIVEQQAAGTSVLVAVMRRALVEHYERALAAVGARPGLVDLATPNLLNLCRDELSAAGSGSDVALLNSTPAYFTLVILRAGRLIFFRCKTYGARDEPARSDELLAREIAGSFSYYQEKLGGSSVHAMFVRSSPRPAAELLEVLREVGLDHAQPLDLARAVDLPAGQAEAEAASRAAPALGAAAGRA